MKTSLIFAIALAILAAACLSAQAWQQDKFIVTMWCPPPATDEAQSAASTEGYNLTWVPADKLDVVYKAGLKALVQHPLLNAASLDKPATQAKLDALIDRVKDHPATEGYVLTDEPGAGAFAGLGRLVEYLRVRDPKHLAYINLYPTYANLQQLGVSADEVERAKVGQPSNFAGEGVSQDTVAAYREHLRRYVDIVKPDLISYDHYHFLKSKDGKQYFLNLELIREVALKANLPFLNIIQACDGEPNWRLPSRNEMRFLIYTTMAYGGRGISYFRYWGPKSVGGLYHDGVISPIGRDAAALNKEMNSLGPELMKLQSKAVYHTDDLPFGASAIPSDCPVQVTANHPCVLGLFDNDALMVVNRDYNKATFARLTFSDSVSGLREYDRKTGRWKSYCRIKAGSPVSIDIAPGDGRLFRTVK